MRRYLDVLVEHGIQVDRAILFGSQARGTAGPYSDIDILVLAEEFDRDRWGKDDDLWILTGEAGFGLQPIPVGVKQFIEDDSSVIIEMARREGVEIRRN
ncbi:MAG TPA: nucleotidyltransferase domain-containing protein [bacterium]|nr:nucleotidyltransferase domain-containing protein [bacterium]